jgi:ADP-ribosylglycohydrolase
MGALIGDAVGAVLEMGSKHPHQNPALSEVALIDEAAVKAAMKFPGGGVHSLGNGEITDDGELTMSLLHGLVEGNGKLDLDIIATMYARWFNSKPFGMSSLTTFQLS